MPVLPRSGRRHSGVRHALFHARTGGAQRVGGRHHFLDRPRRSLPGRRGPLVYEQQQQQQNNKTNNRHQIDRQTDKQTTKWTNGTGPQTDGRTDHCLRYFNRRRRTNPPTQKKETRLDDNHLFILFFSIKESKKIFKEKTDWLIKISSFYFVFLSKFPKGIGTGSAYVLAVSTTCDSSLTVRWRWSCRACWPGATLASTRAPSPTKWDRSRPAPASPSRPDHHHQLLLLLLLQRTHPITTPSLLPGIIIIIIFIFF